VGCKQERQVTFKSHLLNNNVLSTFKFPLSTVHSILHNFNFGNKIQFAQHPAEIEITKALFQKRGKFIFESLNN
jgi:hypothetical protein